MGPANVGSGLGVLFFTLLFVLTIYYERFQNKQTGLVFKIAIISFMFIPLGLLVQLIGRVAMYFAPATIIAYPVIALYIKKPINKIIFVLTLILFTTFTFYSFFSSETWSDAFGNYTTIFSADKFY
jgi:hypothetical protein